LPERSNSFVAEGGFADTDLLGGSGALVARFADTLARTGRRSRGVLLVYLTILIMYDGKRA
jgi:hypothetical protein